VAKCLQSIDFIAEIVDGHMQMATSLSATDRVDAFQALRGYALRWPLGSAKRN
jgi:hypothetical protein